MAKLSVVKLRQFVASVVALVAAIVVLAIAAGALGWNIPVLHNITNMIGLTK